jgi:hypothetical protein
MRLRQFRAAIGCADGCATLVGDEVPWPLSRIL